MKFDIKIIAFSIFTGLLVWLSDTALNHFFFSGESSWTLLNVPENKFFNGILIVIYFFLFGSIIAAYVNKLKKSTEAPGDYEFKYKTIAEETNVWEFWKNTTGGYNYVSPAFERITGYLVRDLRQNPDLIKKIIHPDDFKRVLKHLEEEKNNTLASSGLEFRIVTQNNQIKSIKHTCLPVYDKNGKFKGTRGSNAEIPEQTFKNVEEEKNLVNEVFNSISQPLYIINANNYTVEKHNNAAGINREGQKCYKASHGTDEPCGEEHPCLLELVKKSKKPEIVYYTQHDKSGNPRQIEMHAYPLFGNNGNVEKIIEHSIDITEFKQTKNDLKASEEQLDVIFELSHDAFFLYDLKGTFINCNRAAEELTGYKKNTLIGQNFLRLKLLDMSAAVKQARLLAANALGNPTGPEEFIINRKNGSKVPIEIRSFPVKISGSTVVFSVACDISDRKLAEGKLQRSEGRFRDLYENSMLGIFRSTPDGKIIMANSAALTLLGYPSLKEILKLNLADGYYDPTTRSKLQEILEREGTVHGFEAKWKKPDGTVIYIRESSRIVTDENGKAAYYEGILEDITGTKEVEKALIKAKENAEEMNRLKSNFLANMSHELRTPLIGITGFANMLMEDSANNENKQMAEIIMQSGERLSRTLDLILDLSMLESDKLKVSKERINIINALEASIDSSKKAAQKKGLKFNFARNSKEIYCNVDKNLFNRVIHYFLDNSIKFTHKGSVNVNVFSNGNATIQITDTGIGIPKDKLKTIFEPFRQASEGYSREYEGTGLGLTIAKKFVGVLGGTVSVKSKEAKGTILTIEFPEVK